MDGSDKNTKDSGFRESKRQSMVGVLSVTEQKEFRTTRELVNGYLEKLKL
jgi:hypothetical protein